MSPRPSPAATTPQLLSGVIAAWKATVAQLQSDAQWRDVALGDLLSLYVSLTTLDTSKLTEPYRRLRDFLVSQSPLSAKETRQALETLLASDFHLRATCRTPWGLGRAIEVLVLQPIAQEKTPIASSPPDQHLVEQFVSRAYEWAYTRHALAHVYNLETEDNTLGLAPINGQITRLLGTDIPLITGESTPVSRLHPEGIGNCFVMFSDDGYDDDIEWLKTQRAIAQHVVQVLQYFRYGTVSLDYAAIYFRPFWINTVWRTGIYLWGTPRQTPMPNRYVLRHSEVPQFERYLRLAASNRDLINDLSSSLAKARSLAGEYYEAHHSRETLEDQLLDLAISLEALFSPNREGELSYRMAQSAAILLGPNSGERRQIFALVRKVYDERSKLVHGGGSPFTEGRLSREQLATFGDLIRRAVLRFLTWQARGVKRREDALQLLTQAALDEAAARSLYLQTDFDELVGEA